jgi:hypothetical protein
MGVTKGANFSTWEPDRELRSKGGSPGLIKIASVGDARSGIPQAVRMDALEVR